MKRRDNGSTGRAAHTSRGRSALPERFRALSISAAQALGSPWLFAANVILIMVWLLSGPIFGFSDTWQLVINTATTVITYLAVFLIQNTQNRDSKATHLKLDELICSLLPNQMEFLSDRELQVFELIGQGLGSQEIAVKLHRSVKTVASHRENLKKKLDLKNASELVRQALQWVQTQELE